MKMKEESEKADLKLNIQKTKIMASGPITSLQIDGKQHSEICLLRYAAAAAAKSLQSCLTLCDPIDGSPPGSPVPGILQARTLEWVAKLTLFSWAPKSLQMVTAAMKLKDTCSLEEKL